MSWKTNWLSSIGISQMYPFRIAKEEVSMTDNEDVLAFLYGEKARKNNLDLSSNPYPKDYTTHQAWPGGWNFALAESSTSAAIPNTKQYRIRFANPSDDRTLEMIVTTEELNIMAASKGVVEVYDDDTLVARAELGEYLRHVLRYTKPIN
jgi:FtsP/CotA-like multicopper oxidase with cupredoxin domain